jgi:hypothetical protein
MLWAVGAVVVNVVVAIVDVSGWGGIRFIEICSESTYPAFRTSVSATRGKSTYVVVLLHDWLHAHKRRAVAMA